MKVRTSYIIPPILLFLFSVGYSQPRQVTLQLKWWHQFQFAGYYAAQKQGYYAEKGLNVILVPGNAKLNVTNEVLSGRADFGITGCDLLTDFASGKPLVAMGALFQHSPYVIITDSAKNLHSPFDLINKPIMASENQGWMEMKAIFLKEGIDTNTLNVIRHSWNNQDLVSGKAAAITGYRSVEPYQLQRLGITPAFIYPAAYGIDFYGDLLFTTRSFADNHAATTESFRLASFKGWDYAIHHKEELCNYILSLPGVKERNLTKQMLMQEADEMEKLVLPQLVEIGHMNEGRWESILAVQKALGLVPENVNLTNFLYHKKSGIGDIAREIGTVTIGFILAALIFILVYIIIVRRAVNLKTREQKIALDALRISEEKYRHLVEKASDGILICNPELSIKQANPAALTMFGYASEDLYKLSLPEIMVGSEKAKVLSLTNLKPEASTLSQWKGKRKEGDVFYLEINATRLPNGNFMGFIRDITEKKKAEVALKEKNKELNKLSAYLQNIREEERKKIAREVHDELGQLASAIKINIDWLSLRLGEIPEPARKRLEQAGGTVQIMLTTIREIASNLRPSILDDFGLHVALKWQCEEFIKLNGIDCMYTTGFDDNDLSKQLQTELFRITQESLTNVMRHAKATKVTVQTSEDESNFYLTIQDNGIGFNISERKNTLGLLGLQERAASLHGRLHINSITNQGTTITAIIPKTCEVIFS